MFATSSSILPCTVWLIATTTEFTSRVLTSEVLLTEPDILERRFADLLAGLIVSLPPGRCSHSPLRQAAPDGR